MHPMAQLISENLGMIVLPRGIILPWSLLLELSKLHIYKTFYKTFKSKYPDLKLLYTDTDSLTLQIFTNDLYKDLENFPNMFDFSNYPQNHKLFNNKNKSKLGFLKTKQWELQLGNSVV